VHYTDPHVILSSFERNYIWLENTSEYQENIILVDDINENQILATEICDFLVLIFGSTTNIELFSHLSSFDCRESGENIARESDVNNVCGTCVRSFFRVYAICWRFKWKNIEHIIMLSRLFNILYRIIYFTTYVKIVIALCCVQCSV